jgi:hypothetical protein
MRPLPPHPVLYEINTWVWLSELSAREGRHVTLSSVPEAEWNAIGALGIDAVWFMGVWQRSEAGRQVTAASPSLVAACRRLLPDLADSDIVGSAYCVRDYRVDPHLGGDAGLAAARHELARRGVSLVLDFVPNHVAPDHEWTSTRPELLVRGSEDDLARAPDAFRRGGDRVFACGRDPCFPAWQDVVQVNAFEPSLRAEYKQLLARIAGQCDGVRCDMAMLVMNDVFGRTWGERPGPPPDEEFWPAIIGSVRAHRPAFTFIAEAYWDLEWALQQHGFDYCYDKRLYDRLLAAPESDVRGHLHAERGYQARLLRVIENHDELRALEAFGTDRERAAAALVSSLPGAKLYHEGQFEGRRAQVPVFLGRRPAEAVDGAMQRFYTRLLRATHGDVFHYGEWALCETTGWPDNDSHRWVVATAWWRGGARHLTVVNLSPWPAQARVRLPWDSHGQAWRLTDPISGQTLDRNGDELAGQGLFVDLAPWAHHVLSVAHGTGDTPVPVGR